LKNAKFDADTRLDRVDFSGADLSRATMKKFQARECIYDSKTQFPDDFKPAKFGFVKR